ncbi:hypothetical protein [Streptomyces sp. 147326]|uniref:hypothetical protein n=1 Tax=Streptomyces sp. 147326 TaxID=3074379 RepID=UPI0038572A59
MGLMLTCDLWDHYLTGGGMDKNVDVDELLATDEGFRIGDENDHDKAVGVEEILQEWAAEASAGCGTAESCSFEGDSEWRGTHFTDPDGAFGIGNAEMRITAQMDVVRSGSEQQVKARYTVELYKDWNFDKNKSALGISLEPFAEMHEYGVAREYAMVGKSSTKEDTY